MTSPTGRPRGRPRKPVEAAKPKPARKPTANPPKPKPKLEMPKALAEPELDDLIGFPAERETELEEEFTFDLAETYGGVSAHWLAQMFGADKNTIKKKLAASGIEIVGRRQGGPLYRLADAAAYLVKPKVDLITYIKGLRPNDLPPMLNEAYWSAMIKRQKWEENAKDLWRTGDVLEVFGDLNLMFRTTVNLWVEEVDRINSLTAEQRVTISQNADKLLDQVYEMLVELPAKRKTSNTSVEEGTMPEGDESETGE